MHVLLSLLFVLVAALPGTKPLSYRNLTREDATRDFYRDAATRWSGKRVHLHVPAKRVLGTPSRIAPDPRGGKLFVFENQSVPLIIDPGNVYFRKIQTRAKDGERVCVKGEVRKEPAGGKDRLALWVHTVKRAHDAATGKNSKKSGASSKPKSATTKR